ncbi:MAG: CYTH domain-containing protein [Puniceicoccaceae bacterium]
MSTEIERKFLVDPDRFPGFPDARKICQAYLDLQGLEVRVRISDQQATLNFKSGGGGIRRLEFEIPIETTDAEALIQGLALPGKVEKVRQSGYYEGKFWEVDFFSAPVTDLVLAEVELEREDEAVDIPTWAIREVTGELAYTNAAISRSSPTPPPPRSTQ